MQATLTPAPIEPKPEGTVTLTMTETEASNLVLFLGRQSFNDIKDWILRKKLPLDTNERLIYNATSETYSALDEVLGEPF